MSRRHQASRRRAYGRREHELHERMERHVGVLDWVDEVELPESSEGWRAEPLVRAADGGWSSPRGID
jgi:hypothetical protein